MMRTVFRLHVEAPLKKGGTSGFVHGRRRQNETPSWAAGVGRDGKDMEG